MISISHFSQLLLPIIILVVILWYLLLNYFFTVCFIDFLLYLLFVLVIILISCFIVINLLCAICFFIGFILFIDPLFIHRIFALFGVPYRIAILYCIIIAYSCILLKYLEYSITFYLLLQIATLSLHLIITYINYPSHLYYLATTIISLFLF